VAGCSFLCGKPTHEQLQLSWIVLMKCGNIVSSFRSTALAALLLSGSTLTQAAEFYAAPDGSGPGTLSNPSSLTTALSGTRARPGDTIYLRGGTYRGTWISKLTGTAAAPILVRPYGRERVTLDGSRAGQPEKNVAVLAVEGGYVHFHDLEVTNSDPERRITVPGSNPPNRRGSGVYVRAPGVKIINCVIHDAGEGINAYIPAPDFEAYGNLIYNNGWSAPDRGHGHGIYTQNDTGLKLYRENIVLQQFGDALHLYGSDQSRLRNVRFTGNALFIGRNLLGGGSPLENVVLENNMTYSGVLEIGYGDTINRSVTLLNNYIGAGLFFRNIQEVVMQGNTVFNHIRIPGARCVSITLPPGQKLEDYRFEQNHYVQCSRDGHDFYLPGKTYTFPQWQELGLDRNGTWAASARDDGTPSGTKAFLRKNQYDSNRAMLVIYNWDRQDDITIDLSSFLAAGDEYELRSAHDYFGDVTTRVHDGAPVNIRMTGRTVARPVGAEPLAGAETLPQAGVFVLLKTPAAGRKPVIAAVVNAASRLIEPLAPGTFVLVSGEHLGPGEPVSATPAGGTIPDTLAGVRVSFDGVPAPMLFASAWEVGAVVPGSVEGHSISDLRLETSEGVSDPVSVQIARASPALFSADGSGTGQVRAWNEDGRTNSSDSPAMPGSFITLLATGLGRLPLPDGVLSQTPHVPSLPVKLHFDDMEADPEFVAPPDASLLGTVWMRVRVPDALPGGETRIAVSAGDRKSTNPVTITLQ
jgi:uncharacterized protein (TIGR03437 family)